MLFTEKYSSLSLLHIVLIVIHSIQHSTHMRDIQTYDNRTKRETRKQSASTTKSNSTQEIVHMKQAPRKRERVRPNPGYEHPSQQTPAQCLHT